LCGKHEEIPGLNRERADEKDTGSNGVVGLGVGGTIEVAGAKAIELNEVEVVGW
jgi:hypothetical protein